MAKKQTEQEQFYTVLVLRKDGDNITAVESADFEECYKVWEELQGKWTEAVKEVKPFVLKDPILTAFEPGLIYEITLRPLSYKKSQINTNNPYARDMLDRGFSNTFGNPDLLSRATDQEY